MTDATPLTLTAPDVPPSAPAAPAPESPTVTMTQEQFAAYLQQAVSAGAATAAVTPLGAAAVQAEQPEDWTQNEFMRHLVAHTGWYTEREQRAAYAAVDKYYPVPVDGES